LAFILLCFPCWSFLAWKRAGNDTLPLFPIVSLMYWLFFAVPLFWVDRLRPSTGVLSILPDTAIPQAMLLSVVGVTSLATCMRLGLGRRFRVPAFADLRSDTRAANYVRIVFALSMIFSLGPSAPYSSTEEFRQVLTLL